MSYLLCWISHGNLSEIQTTTSLEQTLDQANQGCHYSLAKMVRLNWMISHIRDHGVIKPIWCRDQNFQTIVGDTRVMAARLAGLTTVPVMCYLPVPRGVVIERQADILALCGLAQGGELLYRDSDDILHMPPSWVEISHPSTAGHGHDQQARLQAMLALMAQRSDPLDLEWLCTARDWGDIFS